MAKLGNKGPLGIAEHRRHPAIKLLIITGFGALGIISILTIIGGISNSGKSAKTTTPAHPVAVSFGDEIPCQINTAIDPSMNIMINEQIKNPHTWIERSQGILTVRFDTLISIGIQNNILIRGFDKNGQYLFHFITKEKFSTLGTPGTVALHPSGNTVQYPINLRDAGYVGAIEIGLVALNR
jgi:hypothetical protein